MTFPRGWSVALCQSEAPPGPGCQPTVLSRYPYRLRGDTSTYDGAEFRGACFGCAWLGAIGKDENTATEDAHNHSFPEWRHLPAIEPYAYDDRAKRARLSSALASLYPPGWQERCGPTVTYRDERATRHVPGGGLFGGYCMSRLRLRSETGAPDAEQLELFAG